MLSLSLSLSNPTTDGSHSSGHSSPKKSLEYRQMWCPPQITPTCYRRTGPNFALQAKFITR